MRGNSQPALLAISDLHVTHPENRRLVSALEPSSDRDWLIVAGDVGESVSDIEWALGLLASRFERVIWTPGNHELWTMSGDKPALRGLARYTELVRRCRVLGVTTPEDPYPVWTGPSGPVRVCPLFLLYDYSFRPPGARTKDLALEQAFNAGIVCTDEVRLDSDPYPSIDEWCQDRVLLTKARLDALDTRVPLVLVNHYPLIREPTEVLHHPEFALWCGTERTARWHTQFQVASVVYGHLHIRRTTWHDGVPFMDVSVGYPREWLNHRWISREESVKPLLVELSELADAR